MRSLSLVRNIMQIHYTNSFDNCSFLAGICFLLYV